MKALVISATINEGITKKRDPNGVQYQIPSVTILVPFEPRSWNNENGQGDSRGYGMVTTEIALHPDALSQFRDLKFPDWYELETETEYRRSGAVSVVHGVKPQPLKNVA